MRISTITKSAYAATIGLSCLSASCLILADRAIEAERQAERERTEYQQLALDLASASDHLTNEARRYTIFGDRQHFDNYWREVKETATRDRVVARLAELGAPRQELDLIEEAKRKSDTLIAIEEAAMDAVAAGDLEQARGLMYGPDYDRGKAEVTAPVARFQEMLAERTSGLVESARERADAMTLFAHAAIAAMALAFLAILYGVLSRRIVTPLLRMSGVVTRLAGQDYDVEVPDRGRADEIGGIADAVQILKDGAIARRRMEAEQAEARAVRERRAETIEQLVRSFETAVSQSLRTVTSAATQLDATAQDMSQIAEETTREAGSSAAAAEQTSANVQTVAAASEEMAASLQEISRQVATSTAVATQAVREAEQTNATVSGLAEAARRVGDVVQMIQSIAGQTNLLALNATIEAARAGEAGKGFTVVASEVKSLANQTARATEEISAQIASIQAATGTAVAAIQGIGGTISSINEVAAAIAAAIEEQGAATGEISRNVQQAAAGTQEVSRNVAQVMQAAGHTGAASAQVLGAARELSHEAGTLGTEIDRFLASIRAA
ncbi:HAMP domain-containing methyl-accepting chemotaxis protein [Arenibaculum sp.]|uniref:methyl-accepting chemotaxis protein n=1 Tax=Arenibaculum sp. TaxID=2865862 RepID=UPI002E14D4EB|nr:HAMP domain-containing methyl-accepting chemotaxis protein [Arenibaculum sp.]